MPRYIGKIDGRYFEYSTVVDAPVTVLMGLEEFKAYYLAEYGRCTFDGLEERLARADTKGTSSMLDSSLEDMLLCNRCGPGETELSVEDFKAALIAEAEKMKASSSPNPPARARSQQP